MHEKFAEIAACIVVGGAVTLFILGVITLGRLVF